MGGDGEVVDDRPQWDVFVSYTSADEFWAEWVAWALEQIEVEGRPLRVLFQKWHMVPGTHWDKLMEAGTRKAARTVAVYSPDYLNSPCGSAEWLAAYRADNTGAGRQLIPVRVADCAGVGLLGGVTGIDLVGLDEREALERLVEGVRASLVGSARPVSAPPFPVPSSTVPKSVPERPDFPGALPPVFNVRRANPRFTGREALLVDLDRELSATGRVTVASVRGLGGVGKTEMAVEYCHRHTPEFDVVWWVDAEEPTSIPAQLTALGLALGIGDHGGDPLGAAALVKADLGRRARWLLVFDNAEDPSSVDRWVPAGGGGRVLVTTRRSGFRTLGLVLEVPVWERAESVAFLISRCPGISTTDADRLADILGDLPLALEQAAAYVDTEQISPGEYLALWQTASRQLLAEGQVRGHAHTVATVWSVSVERIQVARPAAARLLQACAVLAADPIPLELFTAAAEAWPVELAAVVGDLLAWEKTVGGLAGYALVTRSSGVISLHRLVQATTVAAMTETEREQTRSGVLAALSVAAPDEVLTNPGGWVWWRAFLPHVLAAALPVFGSLASDHEQASGNRDSAWYLVTEAATYLYAMGQVGETITLYEQVLTDRRRVLGDDHPETLDSRHNLAVAYRSAGRLDVAISLQEQVLADQRRVLGDDHPDTLIAGNQLAIAYRLAGRLDEAITLHEQVLADQRRVLGDDHPDTLIAGNQLASDYRSSGRLDEAITLYEQVLADHRRVLGEDHPHTLTSVNNLAYAYAWAGRSGEAVALHEQVLADQRRVLGEDHPHTLTSVKNLAHAYRTSGRLDEALTLFEQALTDCERILGSQHPLTTIVRDNLTSARRSG
jgi:tetratricopeptide (TPR) repeat protein